MTRKLKIIYKPYEKGRMEIVMAEEKDIENIVRMLDEKAGAGVGRIKIDISEEKPDGTVSEETHYGRCDIKG